MIPILEAIQTLPHFYSFFLLRKSFLLIECDQFERKLFQLIIFIQPHLKDLFKRKIVELFSNTEEEEKTIQLDIHKNRQIFLLFFQFSNYKNRKSKFFKKKLF